MGNIFIYWTLQSFCLLTCIICGAIISKSKYNYWKTAFPLVIVYSLVEGLRWNRGVDYPHYCQDLISYSYADYSEPLYLGWISLFKASGLSYWVAFVLYSALLIISYLKLVKNFRNSAYLSLPLFFIITNLAAENLIRQYLAVPFVILCIDQVWRKKWIVAGAFALVAANIHYSAIIPLAVIALYEISKLGKVQVFFRKLTLTKSPYILIALFLFTFFFWKSSYMNELAGYIFMFDISTEAHGAGYLSDRWLTTEGIADFSGQRQISLIARTLMLGTYLPAIYFGFYAMKNNAKVGICFWFSYLAIIIDNIRGDFEIYDRIEQWFLYITPVLYAIVYENIKSRNIKIAYGILLFLQFFFYSFIKNIGSMPYFGCAFVWDK